jgi:hypothetical protein
LSNSCLQLFEVPSNLVIKKLTPSRYIASIAVIWGIIATLTGIVQSYGGLIACRVLLGEQTFETFMPKL